jgi:hypothetical protein
LTKAIKSAKIEENKILMALAKSDALMSKPHKPMADKLKLIGSVFSI